MPEQAQSKVVPEDGCSQYGSRSSAKGDSSNEQSDLKRNGTSIACCILAMGVVGLATILALEMSNPDDQRDDDSVISDSKDENASDSSNGGFVSVYTRVSTTSQGANATTTTAAGPPGPPSLSPPTTRTTTTTHAEPPASPDALRLAAKIINASLNWSYNPCDDFFGFVCSRYESARGPLSNLGHRMRLGMEPFMLNLTQFPRSGQKAAERAAALIQACIALGSSAANSQLDTLKSFLSTLDLDMATMPTDPNITAWDQMAQLSLVHGLPTFVEFRVTWKKQEADVHMRLHDEDERRLHYVYNKSRNVEGLSQIYGDKIRLYNPNIENISAIARRIVGAENIVRQVILNIRQNAVKPSPITIDNLEILTGGHVSQDKWERLVPNHTLKSSNRLWVAENSTALVRMFMDNTLLTVEDARLLLAWSLVERLLEAAHGQELIHKATDKSSAPTSAAVARFCYRKVFTIMDLAISRRYVSTLVPMEALLAVRRIVLNVKESLVRTLRRSTWMKGSMLSGSVKKAEAFRFTVGYPDAIFEESAVEALYADFPDVGANFLESYLQTIRARTHLAVRGKPIVNFDTAAGNAFYTTVRHTVTFYAAIMQPPVFILNGPAALNYGGFGQIAAHEMTHAYDVKSIRTGVPKVPSLEEYEKRVLCLRASYHKAESDPHARNLDHRIDSEGVADFGGILLAYDAFQHLSKEQRTTNVPDVELSAEQIFFVAQCMKWCTAHRGRKRGPKSTYWHLRSRCIVPSLNMPEFSLAFSCKRGDVMNPMNRCDFW